jgi:hypothetical protein
MSINYNLQFKFNSKIYSISISGHFTQLVWDTTTRLGVGLAKSSTGRNIVVMKYDPPGNYVGQYTKHVHKPVNSTTPPAAQ